MSTPFINPDNTSISIEDVRYLCSLHHDAANAAQTRLLTSTLVITVLLSIATALALSARETYAIYSIHRKLEDLVKKHESVTRQKYGNLRIAGDDNSPYKNLHGSA